MTPTKKRGRPTKERVGLGSVLYVRLSQRDKRRLNKIVRDERRLSPGHAISAADVVREILKVVLAERESRDREATQRVNERNARILRRPA